MQESHKLTFNNYEALRIDARAIAHAELPNYLKRVTKLKSIDNGALAASKLWDTILLDLSIGIGISQADTFIATLKPLTSQYG